MVSGSVKKLRVNLIPRSHLPIILLQVMVWIGAVVAALFFLYVKVFNEITEAEIKAVALTVSILVGFIAVRFPFSVLRAIFASYIIMPLMGFSPGNKKRWRDQLFSRWVRILSYAGLETKLTETPSYERVAKDIVEQLKTIERELSKVRRVETVDQVQIISRIVAFDIGEEHVRGRIVNLEYFHDKNFLHRLAVGARSESVRVAARRRLEFLRICGDDRQAFEAYVMQDHKP